MVIIPAHQIAASRFCLQALRRCVAFAALTASWTVASSGPVGPTVQEVIEFTRIIQPLNHDGDALQTQIAPDAKHAFIVTRKADVNSDKNRFEILLFDVDQKELATGRVGVPVRLWALDALKDSYDADPPLRDVRWMGNDTLVFRARMHDQPFQVYRLDVRSRRLTQLTFEPLGLVSFDITGDMSRVVYVAPVPNSPIAPGARSVVVGTNSFWSIHGPDSLRTQLRRYRYVVTNAGSRQPGRQLGAPFAESSGGGGSSSVSISPDGRWALLPCFEPARQAEWSQRYPRIGELTAKFGPSVSLDPLGYYSRPQAFVPRRLVAYRLADGREQTVLDAPDDSTQSNQQRADRLWQPGGRSLVIAGTYLPRTTGGSGTDPASHIVEYWPESGSWKDIAVLKEGLKETLTVPGKTGAFVAVDGEERRLFERGPAGNWIEAAQPASDAKEVSERRAGDPRGSWRLRVEEGLNQPPDIVAIGPAGESVRLTRLNPQFSPESWGTMRKFAWKDAKGRQWDGGLMVPAGFDPAAKHALVIQTYGFAPDRFYRDGTNMFETATGGFAGRAFLRENILVLAMPTRATVGEPEDLHERTDSFIDGVRAAIEALVAQGTVDRDRIGIIGWSATGALVQNLVTFTDTPIRAASLVDGDSNTLFSMTITYSVLDGIQLKKERLNQGTPFGATLGRWIRNDPSLHTDCVKAALRFEAYGPHVHNNWDVYALLRRQYRPAEMVVFPEGEHALSRPSERMISLQGNVDWFRFWLKGEQRTEIARPGESVHDLADQNARWNQMAKMSTASMDSAGCSRDGRGE